jgi:hypothetical protein
LRNLLVPHAEVLRQNVEDRVIVVQIRDREARRKSEEDIYIVTWLVLIGIWYVGRATVLIDMENCGGFLGSHRQFGGVQVRVVYIFLHIDTSFPSPTANSSCVAFVEFSIPGVTVALFVGSEADVTRVSPSSFS